LSSAAGKSIAFGSPLERIVMPFIRNCSGLVRECRSECALWVKRSQPAQCAILPEKGDRFIFLFFLLKYFLLLAMLSDGILKVKQKTGRNIVQILISG